jgi:hypothetical protein
VVEEDVDTLGGLAFVLPAACRAGQMLEHPSGWRLESSTAIPAAFADCGSIRRGVDRGRLGMDYQARYDRPWLSAYHAG